MPSSDTQFKKGQSGNPSGRKPMTRNIPGILRKIGQEEPPDQILTKMKKMFPRVRNMTFLEAVQRYVYIFALKGDSWAVQYIADRTEGKPVQKIEVDTETRIPFTGENAEEFLLNELKRDK